MVTTPPADDHAPSDPAADRTGHHPPKPPGVSTAPPDQPAPSTNVGIDRGDVIAVGLQRTAAWALRFVIVVVAIGVFFWLLGQVWVGVLPIVMAILVTTVLWPAVRFLTARGWPPALAAAVSLLTGLLAVVFIFVAIAPSIAEQSAEVAEKTSDGLQTVQQWLAGPPLNVDSGQLNRLTEQATQWLQGQAGGIASGVFSGVAAIGSVVVTAILVLFLTFFFLKDGPTFLPWLRRISGRQTGQHLTEVLARVYRTLSGFIRTQALVGLIDATLIGLGLVILGVPLAFALAVLTFFAAFIPVVGAVVAGAFAVLVALVSNGLTTALIVLAIVLAVQQLEGNVLLPLLQSKSMDLHAAIVLIAITIGSTLFGIIGAFLAVPVAATLVVVLRYMSEQIDLRTGDLSAADLAVATPEGKVVATQTERAPAAGRRGQDAPTVSWPGSSAMSDPAPKPSISTRIASFLRRVGPDRANGPRGQD